MSVGRDTDQLWTPPDRASDYRPTIAIIESDGTRQAESKRDSAAHTKAQQRGQRVQRVPFGFARALYDWRLCGIPRAGREHLGGCALEPGHEGAHSYRVGDPAPIRPGATPA